MDADFSACVVGAALQDELWTGPRRDDRRLLFQLALRAGGGLLRNVVLRVDRVDKNDQRASALTGVRFMGMYGHVFNTLVLPLSQW